MNNRTPTTEKLDSLVEAATEAGEVEKALLLRDIRHSVIGLESSVCDLVSNLARARPYVRGEATAVRDADVARMVEALTNIRDVARDRHGALNAAWVASTADAALTAGAQS